MAHVVSLRHVQSSPIHDLALSQIDSWLQVCDTEHDKCSHVARQDTRLPTRVLDLDSLPTREEMKRTKAWENIFNNGTVKLKETNTEKKGRYIALSYCWGTSLAYKTVTTNREEHMKGIAFTRLPKTLQDSIIIARYLNIRYIWIDCLCIIQDDGLDWQREAARMADIYSNSYLTVAAASAADCNQGFLGPRKIKEMTPIDFIDDRGSFRLYFYSNEVNLFPGAEDSIHIDPFKDEPLAKRAWTLQERLLPVRSLHFASDHTYWECEQKTEGEDGGGLGVSDDDFRIGNIAEGIHSQSTADSVRRLWYRLVRAYTARNITFGTDRLPALSGVHYEIQRLTGDICYAGLWKRHFLEGLLWCIEDPELDLYVIWPKKATRPPVWRAPSWSFAAVEGVIRYQEYASFGCPYIAEFEDCEVIPAGENPLGELKSGFARIRGPLSVALHINPKRVRAASGHECVMRLIDDRLVTAWINLDFEVYEQCTLVMLTPYAGLAILQVNSERSEYMRVGAVQVQRNEDLDQPLFSKEQYPQPTSIVLI